jgi:hypothetical protein
MFGKEFFNDTAVVRICQNPNIVVPRKLPGPIPRKAGFRTLPRAAGMADD